MQQWTKSCFSMQVYCTTGTVVLGSTEASEVITLPGRTDGAFLNIRAEIDQRSERRYDQPAPVFRLVDDAELLIGMSGSIEFASILEYVINPRIALRRSHEYES